MPWIPFYADENDLEELVTGLSQDPEIAFVVSAGPKRWIARPGVGGVSFTRIALWHVPSGPLPLLAGRAWQRDRWIEDPLRGWKERLTGADPTVPYFGAGHPGIIWLNAATVGPHGEDIGLSSFEWIGNRYRTEGFAAAPETERWWRRLRERIRDHGVPMPRPGAPDAADPDARALPGALARIHAGATRAANP